MTAKEIAEAIAQCIRDIGDEIYDRVAHRHANSVVRSDEYAAYARPHIEGLAKKLNLTVAPQPAEGIALRACWWRDNASRLWIKCRFHGVFDARDGDEAGSVGVVERPDGSISTVGLHNISFMQRSNVPAVEGTVTK